MIDKKLEDLNVYKGNEKFLNEIKNHKTLYISILVYLYFFFILSFYIICKKPYIDFNAINQYITLNIGKGNTFFSDIKNASLYLFSAQATLIGLIFPIVIAYVSLANVGRASSDKLMNIYKTHTGFNIVAASSFFLLVSYALLFFLDSFVNISLFKISQFSFLIWFIFNLYLMYIFLSKTIDFIDGSKKINEIVKYSNNYKNGVRDGFLIIADELNYFLENKNISRAQELEIELVDFLKTAYIKHNFTNEDMSFFLLEIRKIIDNTLDYNNSQSIKKILYIYYYLGNRLSKINQDIFIDKLLEMHYIVLFDLRNKLSLSDNYMDYVYSTFIVAWDSWNAWGFLLKNNISKSYYNYYTFLVASFYVKNNREVETILDTFLRISEKVEINFWDVKKYKSITTDNMCDSSFINLCIDTKFCLIKNILESDFDVGSKKKYINSILTNTSLLYRTTAIRSETRINTTEDLIFSLLRIIGNSFYSDYLNDMFEESKESNRMVNRMYWVDTTSYLIKFTETYAYIYDQFINNKKFSNLAVSDYLDSLDVAERSKILKNIENYILDLNNIEFIFNYFDNGKIRLIRQRYLNLILLLRDKIQLNISDYYSKLSLTIGDRYNIFYKEFKSVYYYLTLSVFTDLIVWRRSILNKKNIPLNYNIDFIDPELNLDVDVIYQGGISLFDEYFLKDILSCNNKYNIISNNPVVEILNLIKCYSIKNPFVLIFCENFIDDIQGDNLNFKVEFKGFNVYLINGIVFKIIRGLGFDFYGLVFNKKLINSIDVLCGNETFKESSVELISTPPPDFKLFYKVDYSFNYKINFDLGYSIFLFYKC
ncbi:hypothetical protein Q5X68_17220 [Acinetobacter baumannii]|nr:hypothetical protein [Acinetobacter baumannii]